MDVVTYDANIRSFGLSYADLFIKHLKVASHPEQRLAQAYNVFQAFRNDGIASDSKYLNPLHIMLLRPPVVNSMNPR